MKNDVILIRNFSSVSPLGSGPDEVWKSYLSAKPLINDLEIEGQIYPVSRLSEITEEKLSRFLDSVSEYKKLDRAVQMLLYAGRGLVAKSLELELKNKKAFINIGSSRGATSVFENAFRSYLQKGQVPVLTSPTSTIGNLSSWLLQDLKLRGMPLSTSVTCSTALQAIINSYAWLMSGLADFAIAGASEAPLTGFTIAQMKALRIYAGSGMDFPCMPCAEKYTAGAGMTLGEGAALFLLEKKSKSELIKGDIFIESFGYASEELTSATSISPEANCLYDSMSLAVAGLAGTSPEIVLMHAPGTEQGDRSEIAAIQKLGVSPVLLSNKWFIGHTFGAAGAFNLEYAIHILKNQKYIDFPYQAKFNNMLPDKIKKIMINAAGFGGNAASLIVSIKD